jgi:sugar lactone lactonase YvrE
MTKRCFLWFVSAFLAATTIHASPPLPALDWAITKHLGTTGAEEVMLNRITPSSGAHLGGIHVDAGRTPNRFYAFDSANNRILGFYGYRPPNADGSFPPADIVIGQPAGWDFGTANGNNTQFLQPTAATLALLPFPFVNSTAEGPRSGTMATDADGNLYVADLNNNRVVKFNDPFMTDGIADDVWGQATFTTRARPPTPSATSLNIQWEYGTTVGVFGAGVEIDPAGNLWVTDSGNHRVLRFPKQGSSIAKIADLVVGQANFTSNTSGTALNKLYKPQAVRVHPVSGELFVLDGESVNFGGPGRLLVFAPPFTNGMSATRELGKITSDQASGLFYARGFGFDPNDVNGVWVADGGNQRLLKLHTQNGAKLDVIGRPDFTLNQAAQYVRFDGQVTPVGQCDGDIGFDSAGRLYFSCAGTVTGIVRIPFPLHRDGNGRAISDGEMLKRGFNTTSGRTMQDHYGLAREGSQLYLHDGNRVLVWNDAVGAPTFTPADFVIGQDSVDANVIGGTFEAHSIGNMHAAGGRLFVAGGDRLYLFTTPITSGGRSYPPLKTISSNTSDLTWNDDGTPVPFYCNGLVYDPTNNVLWISDYPRNRILRVANPLSATPKVNLVIGQTTKGGSAQNHGLGILTTDASGVASPWTLTLDNFGNLYAVDSGFEGRIDNSGNRRVLRFDAAALVPVPGNIFSNPVASGVFCKPTLTTNRNYTDTHRPNTPTHLAFDSQNHMVLLCDSYGNEQGERAYFYPTPHVGAAPQPSQVLTTSFGQPAFAYFDSGDRLVLQDHTWNRVLFYAPGATAPLVTITNAPAIAPAGAATVAVSGTCNANVTGLLTWRTDNGATGTIPASTSWTIAAVSLNATGPNCHLGDRRKHHRHHCEHGPHGHAGSDKPAFNRARRRHFGRANQCLGTALSQRRYRPPYARRDRSDIVVADLHSADYRQCFWHL